MPTALPSQDILQIEEIRDGVLILKNGSLRAVLMASSLNFALKSADEQTAVVMQYQNFLNSLDFSLQFFIESRKLNIEPYIETLRESEVKQTNELLKIQVAEYIEFVRTFVRAANIVTKNFYAVVPFTPALFTTPKEGISTLLGGIGSLLGTKQSKKGDGLTQEKFDEYKNQLWQRVDSVIQGLVRSGVRATPLNTEELIELFYGLYNPGELEKGKPPAIQ
ncbi:hypothetical protein A3G55_04485 [Candidatus Giovannonibacteria bacterium RIFCSPLOWO2_12_FULL_44_25]|uniref:TraC-like domain-containing protein n=2 Tax=Candidatus Giovannoniibacteriota TaxID=1752738 RepID=A0A1F5WA98_9BACT|nr:MAG: hypothetical protein UW15_C0006G0010 [Parcubacteria group bacterium GW2011_GWC1_44_10]KKT59887.1 MAG: hypothetical protein UW53_C0006G0034 [Candidatus Giovannonibacteria bacterium GW2011_GWA1_44_25]KKU29873.1 MAG: hypothetical protein UX43_C0004G0034 [Candidatus Giovannonibacteria bacterium GW2011_GWB1_46_20]OGF48938.1 MAG: hypothetical protein A2120_05035 [Candidatus Giovannonibacteria bacterium GWA2_45_15]OGF59714.1 MAG: hypothetical protein A2W40_01350 [Candidatus Giovannonibacteria 